MKQAEALALKLVAGFGAKLPVALEFSDWIPEASARQRIEPELIASLCLPRLISNTRSPCWSSWSSKFDPILGAFGGQADLNDPKRILRHSSAGLFWRCEGDLRCALSAYNIGMNSKRFAAGLRYIDKIDRHMQTLKTASL